MVERINSFPDFSGSFDDDRISKRANSVLHQLLRGRNSSIRQVTQSRAEQKGFYRLLHNENFSEQKIEQSIVKRCGDLCSGRHVLCITDTSEFNLEPHRGRIKKNSGAGKTTKEGILGFMLHGSFVVDADKSTALGYSGINIWHRPEDEPNDDERLYQNRPIEEKESYKWIKAAEQSRQELSLAKQITVVADREADIYDLLGRYTGTGLHLLIRSKSDRRINANKEKLTDHLLRQPERHTYSIEIKGDIRKGIEKRKAELVLKWTTVELCKPRSCHAKDIADSVAVTVVEAKEKGKTNGIYWRLYTTHQVNHANEAIQIIEWYKQRWYIEQLFRLLKLQCFQIESSQLETGWAVRKLTMLAMLAALRIIQMMLAYDDDNEQSIEELFTKDEQLCLAQANNKLAGETEKLSNPNKPQTVKWAAWIIARLGGWKGYASQRKPGPVVLHRGFIKFYQLYEGWLLAQRFFKDVGTQ
jgi:Transposase DDE domain/Transposase DNA-binding